MRSTVGVRVDRRRAGLFEASALDYDLYRPGYPFVVVSRIVSLARLRSSSRLLEVGCGTGKATVHFASRGFTIDCVDPGQRLIAFARHNCRAWQNVTFTRATFEEIPLEESRYDLVYSAQAFHWVDPEIRVAKAARLLRDGGSLALIYNYPGKVRDPVVQRLSEAIEEESGGKLKAWDYAQEVNDWRREIGATGLFGPVRVLEHRWKQDYSAEGYTGLFRTYSDFLSLPPRVRQRILRRIREFIRDNGGSICRWYDCVVVHARKSGR